MAHKFGHNTSADAGVIRWDGGAASGNAMNMSGNQRDWQDQYNDPFLQSQGRANDNRYIGTKSTIGGNVPQFDWEAYLGPPRAAATGSGSGASSSDKLAREKFEYDKRQDALKLAGMQSYSDSGSANKGFDDLLKMIGDQGKVSQDAVSGAYDKAITNVDEGYKAAQGLGDSGYSALNTYLAANQNDPYSGMQATVGSAPDALTQYLSAYGVSDQPVQGQIQADQLQAQQGAGNFNNLTNVLSAIAQSGASSRGAESAMGQNLFNTTLGQERAGYKTKAEMAQADAMRQIQEIMFQQKLANESSRNAQMQQLAQTLVGLGGNPTGGGVVPGPAAPVRKTGFDVKPLPAAPALYTPPEQIAIDAGTLTEAQAMAIIARRGGEFRDANGY